MPLADTAKLIASLELKDNFSRGIATAIGSVGKLETRLGKIGGIAAKGVSNANRNLQRLGVAAAGFGAGLLVGAVKSAIDFEDAFAGVVKTVDEAQLKAAGLTFADLNQQFRQMALDIPIAATELAQIGEAAGALGIRAQDIEEFTSVVAKLSVTTNLTSEQAATSLGQLGTILHLTGDDFEAFADTLVNLGNTGASTEDQIVELAARFAAAGRSAGLTNNDILALSSAVASMGIEVEAGGSALSRVFNSIAVNIGTSNAKAQAFADALGLSAKDFKKAWAEDALGTFQDFLGKLNELDQFEAAALLKKVGINNTRDVNTVRLMGQNIGFVNEALENSRTATGALGEEATKKFATTASQLQLLKNTVIDIGITIGNELLPVILDVAKEARDFLGTPKAQSDLKKFAKDLAQGFRDLVTAVKGVDWASVGGSLKSAAGFAKGIMDAFLGAPDWLKTAIITGWGLNKLTGGALSGIIGELGKGLIKGVLGMTAGIVNINAGVVRGGGIPGVGGVPVAPAAAGAAGTLGLGAAAVGVVGGAVVGGVAATIITAPIVDAVENMNAQGLAAMGYNTEQIARMLELARQEARIGRAANTVVGKQIQARIDAEREAIVAAVRTGSTGTPKPTPIVPGPGYTEYMNGLQQEQTAALGVKVMAAADQLNTALDRNNDGVIGMREAVASQLGISVSELRSLKVQTGGDSALLAAKLGISVAELQAIRARAAAIQGSTATTSARLATLNSKDWTPTINVKVPVNLSVRTMDRGLVTYRTVVGRRGVGVF